MENRMLGWECEITEDLLKCLLISNILYFITSFINMPYVGNIFCFINFCFITVASLGVILRINKSPIFFISTLLFMIIFNDSTVKIFGKSIIVVRSIIEKLPMGELLSEMFIHSENGIRNLNYAVTVIVVVYLIYQGIMYTIAKTKEYISDSPGVCILKDSNYEEHNSSSNLGQKYTGKRNGYNSDYQYIWDDQYSRDKKVFKIENQFDKNTAYEMSCIDPSVKIVDEYGMEKSAFEYASDYEREKAHEEAQQFIQDQLYYNHDSYYNNDLYSSNDYYSNNDSYDYGSYGNDSWF